jgi:hypothetical protein
MKGLHVDLVAVGTLLLMVTLVAMAYWLGDILFASR